MKYVTLTLFLLIKLAAVAQPYPVPGAEIQPAWVFPLWFEDGTGAKDTIYFCYDINGDENYPSDDTIFGEKIIYKDTSKFWVGIWTLPAFDSTSQVYVGNPAAANLIFNKGSYPLKISWDDTLLYSSSLPFPQVDTWPRARISIVCSDNFGNCPSDIELSLTAVNPGFPFPLIDSVTFLGLDNTYIGNTLGEFTLELRKFDSPLEDPVESLELNTIKIYPTVTSNGVWIESSENIAEIKVINTLGHCFFSKKYYFNKPHEFIDLTSVPAGYYFFIYSNSSSSQVFKILKL